MSTSFFNTVSAREMFASANVRLSTNISAAETEARAVVHSGVPIREAHSQGNLNDSRESTTEGAIKVAIDLADRVKLAEPRRTERFFGEHIREAIAAFRPLWRKK